MNDFLQQQIDILQQARELLLAGIKDSEEQLKVSKALLKNIDNQIANILPTPKI